MHRLSTTKQFFLFAVALLLWAFIIYISWLAPAETLRFIGQTHIDKIAHLVGGIFITLVYEWSSGSPKLYRLLILLFGLAIGWEFLEYLFDTETRFFFSAYPDLWRLDSVGDVVAALLGSYGYFVFAMRRG